MTLRSRLRHLLERDHVNFLITNRLPRRLLSRLAGRVARIEQPLVRDISIGLWRFFSDLDLSEASTTQFRSLRDCFTRQLKPDARPIETDPHVLVSPCDALVGAFGAIADSELFQIKGARYALDELFGNDVDLVEAHRNGRYATLRLTSSMYHRFHSPHDCRVERVSYVAGDAWNVNAPALKRVDTLYCRNERAILCTRLAATGHRITLVPVGAVLVCGIRLHFLDLQRCRREAGRRFIACDTAFRKGEEIGWFEHGSTILVFAPEGFSFCDNVRAGAMIRMGQPLMRLP
jgi:phosphatidylserine decarboxylase